MPVNPFEPTLVVMAAGMGSRFGSAKQLAGVGPYGETILDYSIFDAHLAGFKKVVFVIREAALRSFMAGVGARFADFVEIQYAFQEVDNLPFTLCEREIREKPWGTAHAVWCAKPYVSGPFAVINADDFYGADAFQQMFTFLISVTHNMGEYAMVAYSLDQTLSDYGAVSRGICSVSTENQLICVTEHTRLQHAPTGVDSVDSTGNVTPIDPKTLVSMNFWGFSLDFMQAAEDYFVNFHNASNDHAKGECYLPYAVSSVMERHEATVAVLVASGRWFGLTYIEDRPEVVTMLQDLHMRGTYPSPLINRGML